MKKHFHYFKSALKIGQAVIRATGGLEFDGVPTFLGLSMQHLRVKPEYRIHSVL